MVGVSPAVGAVPGKQFLHAPSQVFAFLVKLALAFQIAFLAFPCAVQISQPPTALHELHKGGAVIAGIDSFLRQLPVFDGFLEKDRRFFLLHQEIGITVGNLHVRACLSIVVFFQLPCPFSFQKLLGFLRLLAQFVPA